MAWHDHAPEIVLRVDCDGAEHTVRWRRGRLRLDDHDAGAEEAFAALGGRRAPCLELLDLWRAAVRDGGFVEEWAGRPRPDAHRQDWLGVALRRLRTEGVQDLLPSLAPARAERMGSVLVSFPPSLQDRAAVAVAARLLRTSAARPEHGGTRCAATTASVRPARGPSGPVAAGAPVGPGPGGPAGPVAALQRQLAEAARLRARIAFVHSLVPLAEHARPAALVPLTCEVGQRPHPPSIAGRLLGRGSWCHLRLGADWLVEVWGRGVAVADGYLVAAVEADHRSHLDAVVVRWEPGPDGLHPELVGATLRPRSGGGWSLAWH